MVRIKKDGVSTEITMTRGDSLYAVVEMTRGGKAYEPEVGDEIRFAARNEAGGVVIYKEIPLDTLLLRLRPEDTEGKEYGAYPFDIQLTTAGGDVDTFVLGTLRLTEEVD